MCGAMVASCMRYGVSDTNHTKLIAMQRLEHTIAIILAGYIMHNSISIMVDRAIAYDIQSWEKSSDMR